MTHHDDWTPTATMRAVSDELERAGRPLRLGELRAALPGHKPAVVRFAVDHLWATGYVVVEPARRTYRAVKLLEPYRPDPEPSPDLGALMATITAEVERAGMALSAAALRVLVLASPAVVSDAIARLLDEGHLAELDRNGRTMLKLVRPYCAFQENAR